MTRIYRSALLAVGLITGLAIGGCASRQPIGTAPGLQAATLTDLPPPVGSEEIAVTSAYRVGSFDKLRVEVFGVTELQRDVQTDAGGGFAFPLIGQVDAGGRTLPEVAREIEDRMRGRYVKRPEVTVSLIEATSKTVTLDGQVNKPGQYPALGNLTLARAVALAGGTSEFAKLDDVVVFRTVGTQKYVALFNLGAIRRGNYPDPQLYANDMIMVGDSAGRRLFRDLLQAAPLLTTPLIILAQNNN